MKPTQDNLVYKGRSTFFSAITLLISILGIGIITIIAFIIEVL
jgi:hypothetical protein